ncbi:MAG: hypothetical protein WKF73_09550 [Nocardioidaceae bacterium]
MTRTDTFVPSTVSPTQTVLSPSPLDQRTGAGGQDVLAYVYSPRAGADERASSPRSLRH